MEKLKEKKFWKKFFILISWKYVQILQNILFFLYQIDDLSSYITYSRDFLRGKIDENKIYKYQNEALKDSLNLSEALEKVFKM